MGAKLLTTTPEAKFILIMSLIQFINILDFMMIMPLGPDFARDLAIELSNIGIIGGAYTLSAAITGLIFSVLLDRFDRRKAINCCLFGLASSTSLASLAVDGNSLVLARLIAGSFGGLLTTLSISIISDVVPEERRGLALGKVMGAFSMASVLGVPFGLELARVNGWRTPFLVLSMLCFVVFFFSLKYLPRHTNIITKNKLSKTIKVIGGFLRERTKILVWLTLAASITATFLIVSILSAHLQVNIGFPRERLGLLYMVGGSISFFSMRYAGKYIDAKGPTYVAIIVIFFFLFAVAGMFIYHPSIIMGGILFAALMVFGAARNVVVQTLCTFASSRENRAAYQSIQSFINHTASSLGAFLASYILVERNNKLEGAESLGVLIIILTLITLWLIWIAERTLKEARLQLSGK